MMRLDKYLCETGFGTRSQVKDLLKKGQVMVNGEVVKKPELKINETTDQILCQGKKAKSLSLLVDDNFHLSGKFSILQKNVAEKQPFSDQLLQNRLFQKFPE